MSSQFWEFLRGWCDKCDKEMRPILEARCRNDGRMEIGAVVECRNPKCDRREFIWQ